MSIKLDEVIKLPVAERADLFLALSSDVEVSEYLQREKSENQLYAEIKRRDKAFNDGAIQLTTIEDLTTRLKEEMPYNVLKYSIVDDEIEDVVLYYESISYNLGLKVENEMLKALNKLMHHPEHYFLLADKIHRRIVIEDFPYMFVYAIEGENVFVKLLFPQKDDPAKLWQRLISNKL